MTSKITLNGLKGTNLIQGGADDAFRCVLTGQTDGVDMIEIHYNPGSKEELQRLREYFDAMSRQLYWDYKK
jgi:hypothetical protein